MAIGQPVPALAAVEMTFPLRCREINFLRPIVNTFANKPIVKRLQKHGTNIKEYFPTFE